MVNDRFNIEDYDILISCYGSSKDDSNFGLVRVRGARLSVIDELSSVGIGIHSNKLYRLMRHRPYVTSSVLEMVVYEDAHLVAGSSSPLDPLHLVYHGISDPHDIFVHSSVIYIVSSGTNEIVCLDEKTFQVVKRIKFPGDGNAWHINCLNVINGKICISAFNICDMRR